MLLSNLIEIQGKTVIIAHQWVLNDVIGKIFKIEPEKLIELQLYFPPLFDVMIKLCHVISPTSIKVAAVFERSEIKSHNLFPIIDNAEGAIEF